MQYIVVGWTRSGAEVYLTIDGAWVKRKYADRATIAVFNSEPEANAAVFCAAEMGSHRVIKLSDQGDFK